MAAEKERDEGWLDFASEAIPDFDFSGCYDNDDVRNHLIGQIGQLRENAEAAEARLAVATDALRDALPFVEAATEPDNTPTVRRHAEKVVAAARAVLVGGDAGLEDPAFDDRLGHGEGRLKPPGLREDA